VTVGHKTYIFIIIILAIDPVLKVWIQYNVYNVYIILDHTCKTGSSAIFENRNCLAIAGNRTTVPQQIALPTKPSNCCILNSDILQVRTADDTCF